MPILDAQSLEFISRNAEQTRRAGIRLGGLLQAGDVICLQGELGSGKTTLVQGICSGWGSLDQASSPTFVLVNVYRRLAGQRLYHLDAYRLSGPDEATDLDLDEMIEDGPVVVEWADRIRPALPADCLWIALQWVDLDQRDLVISAHGSRYQAMLHQFRRQVFGVP
jgi:tRNA threonylcarbamoyladenosine biosynthesis protein TsaE